MATGDILELIELKLLEMEETVALETIKGGEFLFWNYEERGGLTVSFGDPELDCFHRQDFAELCEESLDFLLESQISDEQRQEADDFVAAIESLAAAMRKKLNDYRAL